MRSRRLPDAQVPNAWSAALEARRAAGAHLYDLTEANPTRVGLGGAGPREFEALARAAAGGYAPDPRGLPAARAAVAAYYAARGLAASPGDIVLTAGTSEAYAHLFRLLTDPGDRVLAPRPGYPLIEPIARLEAVEVAHYDLVFDDRWRLDLDSLERAITARTRAVIVVQPNHPTGSCLDSGEVAALEALCERHGLAILADEVFGDFGWESRGQGRGPGAAARGLPSFSGARTVPTFVLSGLSKVCGMPEMKCSWIAASGPAAARAEALHGLEWIADLFLSVSGPVQAALPVLLEARHAFRVRVRERIAGNLEQLRRVRDASATPGAAGFEPLTADGGWVTLLRMPRTRTDEEWAIDLLGRDVIVHPGHFYDAGVEPLLVASLIVESETFEAGVRRIAAAGSPGRPPVAHAD